jgi:hypothetical protein
VHSHYCYLFLAEMMRKVTSKIEFAPSGYTKLRLKINEGHDLTLVVEFRVESCWLVDDWKEVSEVFVLTEKLLHAQEQIKNHFHRQTSILIEVLMHQKY